LQERARDASGRSRSIGGPDAWAPRTRIGAEAAGTRRFRPTSAGPRFHGIVIRRTNASQSRPLNVSHDRRIRSTVSRNTPGQYRQMTGFMSRIGVPATAPSGLTCTRLLRARRSLTRPLGARRSLRSRAPVPQARAPHAGAALLPPARLTPRGPLGPKPSESARIEPDPSCKVPHRCASYAAHGRATCRPAARPQAPVPSRSGPGPVRSAPAPADSGIRALPGYARGAIRQSGR
jgi:hypothetical protein